jgi:hypothetical protein
VALMAIAHVFVAAQSLPSRVELSATCDGRELAFEARAPSGTHVIIAVATALSPDGDHLAIDDPLLMATSIEPSLHGPTGADGTFRVRIPIDAAAREKFPRTLFAQAARLLPEGAGYADPSDVVTIEVPSARGDPLLWWALPVLAALVALVLLPATIRVRLSRIVALVTLAALPFLLVRGHGSTLLTPPHVPFAGNPDQALVEKLGAETVNELRALNATLPDTQAVVLLMPLHAGNDLLLRRLFARRPYSMVPSLALMNMLGQRTASSAVVVTFDRFRPDDADDVFQATTFRAWKRR